eukprot:162874-Rhodomonas_salina.1
MVPKIVNKKSTSSAFGSRRAILSLNSSWPYSRKEPLLLSKNQNDTLPCACIARVTPQHRECPCIVKAQQASMGSDVSRSRRPISVYPATSVLRSRPPCSV